MEVLVIVLSGIVFYSGAIMLPVSGNPLVLLFFLWGVFVAAFVSTATLILTWFILIITVFLVSQTQGSIEILIFWWPLIVCGIGMVLGRVLVLRIFPNCLRPLKRQS